MGMISGNYAAMGDRNFFLASRLNVKMITLENPVEQLEF
jgi:hypothetical protein